MSNVLTEKLKHRQLDTNLYAKRNVANYAPLLFLQTDCSLLQILDLKIYLLQHKQPPLQSV